MSTELQTTRFDYNALERDKARGLRQQATAIKAAIKRTQNDIIEIGNRLRDVRNELTDQSFSAWIDHEFSMSRQSAYNFISVFDSFGSCKTVLQLPFHQSALYALASPSVTQGTRDFAIEYASTGETVTKAVAKEIIAAHRPPVAPEITPEPEIEAIKVDDEGDYFDDDEDLFDDAPVAPIVSEDQAVPRDLGDTSIEQKIESLALYRALTQHGHSGRIFFDQAEIWYENEKLFKAAHAKLSRLKYTTGPVTDGIQQLAWIPEPSQWEGCAACKGTLRVGERADPCPRCKGGFTVHQNQGVSADVIAANAGITAESE